MGAGRRGLLLLLLFAQDARSLELQSLSGTPAGMTKLDEGSQTEFKEPSRRPPHQRLRQQHSQLLSSGVLTGGRGALPTDVVETTRSKLAWLHPEKAGTSFANTLLHFGCPGLAEGAEVRLVDRRGKLDTQIQPKEALKRFNFQHDMSSCAPGFEINGDHVPITDDEGLNQYAKHKGYFMGIFRQPEQRIISAAYYFCEQACGEESAGFNPLALFNRASKYAQCTLKFGCGDKFDARKFGEKHVGTYARMITGQHYSWLGTFLPGASAKMVEGLTVPAKKRLREDFAFVGITESWELSVCLFHAMYGGRCQDVEFKNTRPGSRRAEAGTAYDTAKLLGDWRDDVDGEIYKEAKAIFEENLVRYNVTRETCALTYCPDARRYFEDPRLREAREEAGEEEEDE